VARKQYLDGSIPTGFQRTAIVGVNGRLPFLGRELSITQVSVEEDSCREVSDVGHLIVWRTDRLGMPLIETVTGPDLRTPDEVVEAILLIGRVCRTTGHVRVGMGASRQDVNVSVRGGRRVEIKGVPQAAWARGLVHGEAVRQVNLLELRDELRRRGFKREDDLRFTHEDVTALLESSQFTRFRKESWDSLIESQNRRPLFELGVGPFCVRAIRLRGLAGTLEWPTQPEHTFAREVAGRVRVIAGLDQQPIVVHSDKWPDYNDSRAELRRIRNKLGCQDEDALVLVWGPRDDTLTAVEEVRLRYADALDGIPNETRQPFPDGSTDFERILPGPDRMYPDTDHPPIRMTRERVERLRAPLPPPPWVREERYAAAGVPDETIRFLIRRGGANLVDRVVDECGSDTKRACIFFGQQLKSLRRRGLSVDEVPQAKWIALFEILVERPVLWEAWQQIVRSFVERGDADVLQIVEASGLGDAPDGWDELIDDAFAAGGMDHDDGTTAKRHRYYMGVVMDELRGRVPGCEVSTALKERLERSEVAR
jgi:glutamyl-tRNA(Gln) amidotransferase subunit E